MQPEVVRAESAVGWTGTISKIKAWFNGKLNARFFYHSDAAVWMCVNRHVTVGGAKESRTVGSSQRIIFPNVPTFRELTAVERVERGR